MPGIGPPASVEVLYVDGCPNHEAFLPHLAELLAENGLAAQLTLTRIDNDEDARAHRFLGSPSVRVNGRDVEPGAAERAARHADDLDDTSDNCGMQCRLYVTREGTSGSPRDEWIIAALLGSPGACRERSVAGPSKC